MYCSQYNPAQQYYNPVANPSYVQVVPPTQTQTIPTPQPQATSSNGLIWVQGETGAKSYIVAPNSTVMLMDSEADRFFLKSADPSGMPLPLRVFEYSEITASDGIKTHADVPNINRDSYVTRDEFNALKAEIDGMRATKKTTKSKEDTDNG